jgi:hypothetical protein
MSTLACPRCASTDWLPVVKIFLDVGLDRPPRPLALDSDDNSDGTDVCFRCINGCVGVTGTGQVIPMPEPVVSRGGG